jgi:hypothetical protein
MKKIEYIGFFFSFMLISGVAMTLYPKRLAVATEDTITKTAKEYAQQQLLKIMINLEEANHVTKNKKFILRAKRALRRIDRVNKYAQKVVKQAEQTQLEIAQEEKKTGMKRSETYFVPEAQANLSEIKQIAAYAQWLVEQATLKPNVENKKEKITAKLEELV